MCIRDSLTPATPVYDVFVRLDNVSLRLGTAERDIVVVSNGSGVFAIFGATAGTPGGLAGSLSADVAIDIPGVTFTGSFEVAINTTTIVRTIDGVDIARGVKVSALNIELTAFGQRLTGNFASVSYTHLDVYKRQVSLVVNTVPSVVSRPDLGLSVDAGPLIGVDITAGVLAVSGGPSFSGNFTLLSTAGTTVIGFSNVIVNLTQSGGAAVGITDGTGAFLVTSGTSGGIAGQFSGAVAVAGGSLTAGAQVSVRYNGTTVAIGTTCLLYTSRCV